MMKKRSSPTPSIIGCLVIQLCVGIIYLWSVFTGDIVKSFEWTTDAAKMVASFMIMSFVIGNFVGGFINDKKGPKFTAIIGVIMFAVGVGATGLLTKSTITLIYVTYCIIGGLGSGIAYAACISCIQKWLPHRRGLASGLAVSAFGLSTVVFTPVSKWLMTKFTTDGLVSFQPVFFILAGVFFVLGIAACFLVKLPDQEYLAGLPASVGKVVSGNKNYTLGEAMKTVPFWSLFLLIFFINGTWNLTVPLIKGLGMERGLTDTQAVFAVSFTGIASASGRLIMATLSDKIGRPAASYILGIITLVGAILMTFVSGPVYIVVVAFIAFAYGGPAAINPAICTDFFGPKNSGTNYGVAMLALGLSSIFFNWISTAFLKSAVVPTFVMAAITAVISMVAITVISIYQKKLKKAA